jgi:hypothetical protein
MPHRIRNQKIDMETAVLPFPTGRMTAEQFDAERARLRGLYGDSRKEAGARYEQALARLFYQSGWTWTN